MHYSLLIRLWSTDQRYNYHNSDNQKLFSQLSNKEINQSVGQPINQKIGHPVYASQSIGQLINESIDP